MPSWNVLESTGRNGPGVPEWFTFQRADDFWSRISEKIETLAYVSPTIWILSRAPAFGTLPMPMFGYINTDVGYANMTLKRCTSSTMFFLGVVTHFISFQCFSEIEHLFANGSEISQNCVEASRCLLNFIKI